MKTIFTQYSTLKTSHEVNRMQLQSSVWQEVSHANKRINANNTVTKITRPRPHTAKTLRKRYIPGDTRRPVVARL